MLQEDEREGGDTVEATETERRERNRKTGWTAA